MMVINGLIPVSCFYAPAVYAICIRFNVITLFAATVASTLQFAGDRIVRVYSSASDNSRQLLATDPKLQIQ